MNTYVKREIECMICMDQFGKRPELVLTPKETQLFVTIGTNLLAARNYAAGQVSGRSGYREGAAERNGLARSIRRKLRSIGDLARSMEEEGEVGMTERFRYPRYGSYEALLSTANSFADRAEPMAATFIERGLAATFVADLRALITALGVATGLKAEGGSDQVAGTAGLKAFASAGMKAARVLRPIMREHLKDDPALLAAWNSAARVARSASKAKAQPENPAPEPPAGS